MNQRTILITGANGGIGRALCQGFADAHWRVIASDIHEVAQIPVDHYVSLDLNQFATQSLVYQQARDELLALLPEGLDCLINNAAFQAVASVSEMSMDDWQHSVNINITAPFLLIRALLDSLEISQGNVINIISIHANLTKPYFSAYATSKAALEGLTRSLAVELGHRVRVNAISPAAIMTPMLKAGFKYNAEGMSLLESYHPTQCIGSAEDVTNLAVYLADNSSKFLNGAIVNLDGGIASRLHDPH
ncbi:MAG: NAD(P)-dependent dehydrogenase (short-subunit alcohol dehydrogenase family) [Halioglobus sp.]